MTFAYHVYDLIYYKVKTIAICDMQSKDMKTQCVQWQKLNKVMLMKNTLVEFNQNVTITFTTTWDL
jgi:hypothetical protein